MAERRRVMVAVSGASGAVYARRALQVLGDLYETVYLTISENASEIIAHELGLESAGGIIPCGADADFVLLDPADLSAPPASGSHDYDGLLVIPCSMGVVGRIASGVSSDLVTRAADVCLKERRKLVLVIRETPLSLIHLRSLTAAAEAGAVILPAAPAFYANPHTIDDLVDFVVDRALRALGCGVHLTEGWKQ